jgi:hypothetical protein
VSIDLTQPPMCDIHNWPMLWFAREHMWKCPRCQTIPNPDEALELARKIHARCELWARSQHNLSGEQQIDELAELLHSLVRERDQAVTALRQLLGEAGKLEAERLLAEGRK